MIDGVEALSAQYGAALEAHLRKADESTLSMAYELGREALSRGLGILDVTAVHERKAYEIILKASAAEQAAAASAAADFFREALSPFEMTFRGYRSASEQLQRVDVELQHQKEEVESTNKELESFSYSVSHDLRAPLRSIDGFSQVLLEDYVSKLDADGQRYLGYIRESTQQMAQLIDDLLGLARVNRGEMNRTEVDLAAMAMGIVERLRQTDPARNVTVVIQDDLRCEGDDRLLGIVLDNLLRNAWKFTSKKEDARIELGKEEREGRTVFFVRDNGAGFDMRYVAKLFGVFQRLHSQEDYPGTGIGLAIVQRVIHRHGGRVWAEGAIGQGATFFFTLGRRDAS